MLLRPSQESEKQADICLLHPPERPLRRTAFYQPPDMPPVLDQVGGAESLRPGGDFDSVVQAVGFELHLLHAVRHAVEEAEFVARQGCDFRPCYGCRCFSRGRRHSSTAPLLPCTDAAWRLSYLRGKHLERERCIIARPSAVQPRLFALLVRVGRFFAPGLCDMRSKSPAPRPLPRRPLPCYGQANAHCCRGCPDE